MSEILDNFRTQYPAYSDWSDAELANGMYQKFYSDMDRQDYNNQIGYKGLSQGSDGVSFLNSVKAGIENIGGAGIALKAGVSDLLGNEQAEAAAISQLSL